MTTLFTPVVLVQGGAGTHAAISQDHIRHTLVEDGIRDSARAGYQVMGAGGSAVDAVEAAVISMEKNYIFNCGKGSCLTANADIEMDASIMDGRTYRSGGVICIKDVAHPISVARLIMDKSEHVLLVGEGASLFAREQGVEKVGLDYLMTEKSRKRLEAIPRFRPSVKAEMHKAGDHDTVGAVALDAQGNVAYATSTGGINAKKIGRCGDSPIVGCGGYADNTVGAVSTTGHGESFIKTCLGKHIITLMEQGKSVQEALDEGMSYMENKVQGFGGAVAISNQGDIGVTFTTQGMSWAYVKNGELHYGIYKGEDKIEKY